MGRRWTQLGLQSQDMWGGVRARAGRPARGRSTVKRVTREDLNGRDPIHVTTRIRPGVTLRRHHIYRTLRAAFRRGKDRFGFRLVHYSVQSNHMHLICEAVDRRALSRGMQGLSIRVARGVNRVLGRRGKLFGDRYHAVVLERPRQVRNALVYVLRNAVHHGAAPRGPFFDVYSSAAYFSGWRDPPRLRLVDDGEPPVTAPTVWLLTTGWRRWGLLAFDELTADAR